MNWITLFEVILTLCDAIEVIQKMSRLLKKLRKKKDEKKYRPTLHKS